MQKAQRSFAIFASISGGISVILGAMGAHLLEGTLSTRMLDTYITGVQYQMYHSLALLLVTAIGFQRWNRWFRVSSWMFIAGIILFSGSLYILTLANLPWMGMITPLGGVAFITGWGALVIGVLKTEIS